MPSISEEAEHARARPPATIRPVLPVSAGGVLELASRCCRSRSRRADDEQDDPQRRRGSAPISCTRLSIRHREHPRCPSRPADPTVSRARSRRGPAYPPARQRLGAVPVPAGGRWRSRGLPVPAGGRTGCRWLCHGFPSCRPQTSSDSLRASGARSGQGALGPGGLLASGRAGPPGPRRCRPACRRRSACGGPRAARGSRGRRCRRRCARSRAGRTMPAPIGLPVRRRDEDDLHHRLADALAGAALLDDTVPDPEHEAEDAAQPHQPDADEQGRLVDLAGRRRRSRRCSGSKPPWASDQHDAGR